jgi:sugar lactone lactonase YvrE
VDYDGYGTDPLQSTVFIPIYNQPQVRQIVQAQLQSMADLGATFVDTNIWLENLGQSQSGDIENFPMTDQQAANLRAYAQDVAAVQGANGNRLRLNIILSWLAASDFTIGSPSTGLGSSNLPAAQFTANVQTTIDQVLTAVSNVTRPDGVLAVDTVFLAGEILLPSAGQTGALEENTGWFMTTNYPYFVSSASKAGVRPSVYFGAGCIEDVVFNDSYIDSDYPILNGHRSMAGTYRGVKFMVDNGLPLPTGHIDFDCYMEPPGAPYEQLLQRILDDADAVLPSLGAPQFYFMPETHYLADPTLRLQYGQAFATQAAQSSRLQQVSFWTYRAGISNQQVDNASPFMIEDFLPPPGPTTAGSVRAHRSQAVSVTANASTLTTVASYFFYPGGVAVDAAGNVYVADTENNAVRQIVAATGAVTTLGSGFNTPEAVAVDAAGNVYVADTFNNAVKEIVVATGAVTTLGSGFNTPEAVAVDAAGNVYVADMGNNAVKEIVAATGAVNTLGSGFNQPFGVAVDAAGNVYVGDSGNDAVKEIVAATGVIKTLASGSGVGFLFPEGVAVDSAGNVYVADTGNNGVMEIVAATGAVTSLSAPAVFNQPSGVAVDAAGNVYVADTLNNAVKEIVVATEAVNTLGSGFNQPFGVAVDSAGNVYVADTGNNAVMEIMAATGVIKTLGSGFNQPIGVAVDGAGNVYVADSGNNAVKGIVAATGAVETLGWGFSFPEGVAVDGAGNVYVADSGNNAVKEIVVATGAVNTLGSGFNVPGGVAVDATGNVYVADSGNSAVKEIVAATGAVNTLGSGFDVPGGVAVDAGGNVYVADTFNNAVKEIMAATGAVTTLASGFRFPSGVAVGANGSVYVIDYENVWEFTPSGQMNSVPKRPLRKNPSGRGELRHQQDLRGEFRQQQRHRDQRRAVSTAKSSRRLQDRIQLASLWQPDAAEKVAESRVGAQRSEPRVCFEINSGVCEG